MPVADKPDPDKLQGPGGLNMRELHELVKKGHARDLAGKQHNKLTQPQNRWQRFVRYVWDKNRGRGGLQRQRKRRNSFSASEPIPEIPRPRRHRSR